MENEKQKKKAVPQDWKPHIALEILYRVWRVLFAVFKIGLGAVATVGVIVMISLFVFVGMFGDFLQNDILPDNEFLCLRQSAWPDSSPAHPYPKYRKAPWNNSFHTSFFYPYISINLSS